MTQMQYLQIFADKEELLAPFDDAERGRIFTAMLKYALHCEEMDLPGNERFIWPVFKQMIDQSREALDNKRKAGSARQQTAAEASRPQQEEAGDSRSQHNAAEGHIKQESRINNQELRNKNNNGVEEKHARAARFSPPSVTDVLSYAAEAGLTLDAQKFCDFYASKGWRVGSAPMRDWRAAARNWARRDQPPPNQTPRTKQVGAQQYTQRVYTEDELANDLTDEIMKEAATGLTTQ